MCLTPRHEHNVVLARHPFSLAHMGVEAIRVANSQSVSPLAEATPEGQSLVNIAHFVHLGMFLPN